MPRPKGSKKGKSQSSSPPIQFCSNDDPNWIQTSMETKGSRSKNDENIVPTNEISGSRVVINPAVLRYLEQNRNLVIENKTISSMDINENTQELIVFLNQRNMEINQFIQDDRFWDICTYSTEFLTSARLAEWILMHQQSAKFQTI